MVRFHPAPRYGQLEMFSGISPLSSAPGMEIGLSLNGDVRMVVAGAPTVWCVGTAG